MGYSRAIAARVAQAAIFGAAVAGGSAALAGEGSLSAHVHGVGALDIAIEGGRVEMALRAPGADIVGFETEATTVEQKAAVAAATEVLETPMMLFTPPAEAGCAVEAAEATYVLEGEDDHGDEHGHEEHGHEEHGHEEHGHEEHDHEEHGHDEHAHDEHEHGEKHADGDHDHDHAHDDHDHGDEASHAEFQALYVLTCATPEALTGLTLGYFEAFPAAQEIEAQIIGPGGSSGGEATREAPRLDLGPVL